MSDRGLTRSLAWEKARESIRWLTLVVLCLVGFLASSQASPGWAGALQVVNIVVGGLLLMEAHVAACHSYRLFMEVMRQEEEDEAHQDSP